MTENKHRDRELNFFKITKNSARCKKCGDELISKHRHDFVTCSCGEISVDGGTSYLKRSAKSFNNLEELSEYVQFTVDELLHYIRVQETYNLSTSSRNISDAEYCLNLWYPEKLDN